MMPDSTLTQILLKSRIDVLATIVASQDFNLFISLAYYFYFSIIMDSLGFFIYLHNFNELDCPLRIITVTLGVQWVNTVFMSLQPHEIS